MQLKQMLEKSERIPDVPPHLKPFVVEQHYDLYTAVDHAVWRYVIRQNTRALQGRVHEAYQQYFSETGMTVESIPNVAAMNKKLLPQGWRAVAVDGFIPPSVFMDFQAHGLLPIAQDIRTLEHIGYTPAPDIIHESAGHAPLILDPFFGEFLRFIGELGARAIATRADHEVYEAVRGISISKEDPHASPESVRAAELRLEAALAANSTVSEATELSRLYWWTVEYGLIGTLENPQIYGAGLCSSMNEGALCLDASVKKIPFDLSCIEVAFDITRPQPQLFVAESFEQLVEVTRAFAQRMAYVRGGTESLLKAVESGRVCTAVLASGLQVSGTIDQVLLDDEGEAIAFTTSDRSALAFQDVQLPQHGTSRYPHGLFVPVGTPVELEAGSSSSPSPEHFGGTVGQKLTLTYASGLRVEGVYVGKLERANRLLGIELQDVRITKGAEILLEQATFTLPLQGAVVSVYSGTADKLQFVVERHPSPVVNLRVPQSEQERELESLYRRVRTERENPNPQNGLTVLTEVQSALDARHPEDWLLRVELLEVLVARDVLPGVQQRLRTALGQLAQHRADLANLIHKGIQLISESSHQAAA